MCPRASDASATGRPAPWIGPPGTGPETALCYDGDEPLDPPLRGHATSALPVPANDLGARIRSGTRPHEHPSHGRPASNGTPPGIGVAAAAATPAAAALPTSSRPVLAEWPLRAGPAVRLHPPSGAASAALDHPPPRSKEDPR